MADLTTLDAVRDYLGISDPSETDADGQIGRLITSESQRFISLAGGNPILQASYTDTVDGNGSRMMLVPRAWTRYPLQSVTSMSIDGAAVPPVVSPGDRGYVVTGERLELVGYQFTGYYSMTRFDGATRGVANVTVSYVAGYATVPADVEQAVIEMVALKLRGRARIGVASQSVQGESTSFQQNPWAEIQSVIDLYTRPVI